MTRYLILVFVMLLLESLAAPVFLSRSSASLGVAARYVERNALAAGLVERAEDWRWGSLWNWCGGHSPIKLAGWPIPRLPGWVGRVNQPLGEKEEEKLRRCIRRGSPFGDGGWVESTARQFQRESTLRARGRPRKFS